MVKKWTISDLPPLKVRLVKETEGTIDTEQLVDRPIRVRILPRIVKVLVAIWVLFVGLWLQESRHSVDTNDGHQNAIDGENDSFDVM